MIAVGAYIRTLREARKMSRAELAAKTQTSGSQLVRIENGEQDTRSTLLAAIVNHLGGDFYDVGQLLLHEDATAEEGRQLAIEHLQEQGYEGVEPYQTPFVPTTALSAFLDGWRTIEDLGEEPPEDYAEGNPYDELTDSYLRKVDRNEMRMLDIAIKLRELHVPNNIITFLVENLDLPATVGERLAMTRLGIGDAKEIMKSALATSASDAG
jgi:transcriptional regulator with XRE-family HTH domain